MADCLLTVGQRLLCRPLGRHVLLLVIVIMLLSDGLNAVIIVSYTCYVGQLCAINIHALRWSVSCTAVIVHCAVNGCYWQSLM